MIVTPNESFELDPIVVRNAINLAFRNAKLERIQIATIAKAQFSDNIIITIMSQCSANDVMQHHHIIKSVISSKNITKDERLYKVIAHGVSKTLHIMTELKSEIEMYNDVHLN